MTNSVFITGATSGIGMETAKLFLNKHWNVIAGIRNTIRYGPLRQYATSLGLTNHLTPFEMNLGTRNIDIKRLNTLFEKTSVNVLINNAGYAIAGAVEDISPQELRKQFEVNFFSMHDLVSVVLPSMRKKNYGVIVNVSSMGGRITFPFFGIYNASKHAVESYTEALWMELRSTGIKVYLIEPGLIETDFFYRNLTFPLKSTKSVSIYAPLYEKYRSHPELLAFRDRSHPNVVAQKIYDVVTKQPNSLRHPIGKFARLALLIRKYVPDELFNRVISHIRS